MKDILISVSKFNGAGRCVLTSKFFCESAALRQVLKVEPVSNFDSLAHRIFNAAKRGVSNEVE